MALVIPRDIYESLTRDSNVTPAFIDKVCHEQIYFSPEPTPFTERNKEEAAARRFKRENPYPNYQEHIRNLRQETKPFKANHRKKGHGKKKPIHNYVPKVPIHVEQVYIRPRPVLA